jgi:flagellar hook-associated protein 1 FlgK
MVTSDTAPLVPLGFDSSDPHGFGAGETVSMEVRDANGKLLASHVLTGGVGPAVGDLLTEMNGSPLGAYGSFSLDSRGRVRFAANAGAPGATVALGPDSTDRLGTGLSFSDWSGLGTAGSGLADASVKAAISGSPRQMPLAMLDLTAAIGTQALSKGDTRGTSLMVARLASTVDLGAAGLTSITELSNRIVGDIGTQTARAVTANDSASARLSDAVDRRDSFEGVNTEEELALMVVLQNSYSASARIVSVTSQMYDTLINLV